MTTISFPLENVTIYDLSDKAFCVSGNTKLIKDDLKTLKGKFTTNLKSLPNQACWLFSKNRLESVLHYCRTGEVSVAEVPEFIKPECFIPTISF